MFDELPEVWHAGLVKLRGKKPIEKGFNTTAAGRWENGLAEGVLGGIAQHVATGGNVGLVPPPGVVVIDCDNYEAVQLIEKFSAEDTPWSVRNEDNAHAWFRYELPPGIEGWLSKGAEINGAKLDIRVEGKSQAVIPPSKHSSGVNPYWYTPLPERIEDVPMMPPELTKILIEAGLTTSHELTEIPSGVNAHDTVRGWILSRVDTVETVEELHSLAKRFALYYVQPRRPDRYAAMTSTRELADLVDGAWNRKGRNQLPRLTQAGMGDDRYVHFWRTHFEEQWLHVGEWSPEGVWVNWDGESWKHRPMLGENGFHGAFRRFSEKLKYLRDHDDPTNPDHQAFCKTIEGMRAEMARAKTAASPTKRLTEALSAEGESFDQRPELWSCPAYGEEHPAVTFDFLSQRRYTPKSEDRVTRVGGAPFIPGKRSTLWESFVKEAFPDPSIRRFIQVCAGYTLLGNPREDVVLFLIGRGGSGKSTFIGALEKVFADYTGFVPAVEIDDKLPGSGAGGTNASLLSLRGKRIATCTELSDRVRLGAKLKALSGGDVQSGRSLYSKVVTSFTPRFVIWLGGNFQPEAKAVDTGLTRRMRYVPMEVKPKKLNPSLKLELASPLELAGILNWILEGLKMYLTDGTLITPQAIEDRSLRARVEASEIGPWLHDRVVADEDAEGFTPSEGYDDYVEWFIETHGGGRRGIPVRTPSRFGEEMRALGHTSSRGRDKQDRTKVKRLYEGLRILTTRERLARDDGHD